MEKDAWISEQGYSKKIQHQATEINVRLKDVYMARENQLVQGKKIKNKTLQILCSPRKYRR